MRRITNRGRDSIRNAILAVRVEPASRSSIRQVILSINHGGHFPIRKTVGTSHLDVRLEGDASLTLVRGDVKWWQGALLGVIILASTAPYVTRLGFYSDDWGFLETFTTASDQSFFGLWAAQWQHVNTQARPTQVLTQVFLYQSFGVNPLGYHVANALLLTALRVLLWRVLRQVGVHRQVAFAVPAVALLLPHASTNRFWFAAFGYAISIAAYLASLQCALRALEPRRARRWPWGVGAVAPGCNGSRTSASIG